MKDLRSLCSLASIAAMIAMLFASISSRAQGPGHASSPLASSPLASSPLASSGLASSGLASSRLASSLEATGFASASEADSAGLYLPAAPEPAPEPAAPGAMAAAYDHYEVAPAATWHQIPFSRIGVGADISPLGIGIKSAIVLNHYCDARMMGNFLSIHTGNFKVDGFGLNANLHYASAAAALDFYPKGSVFRVSPGLLFANGNQVSVVSSIVPGTSFTLDGQKYYSAYANPATGATPLSGSGVLGLHRNALAPTVTAGFGKFIPRSNRHWSFPSEFGVAFTGAPTANVNVSGWVCLDSHGTQCSNVGNPANPVAIEFNHSLQTQLTKWRKDLGMVTIYPLFSYGVMYSFNIR